MTALRNELTGRTALVTGGSRGIGRAIALALAEDGADVAVNYFDRDLEAESVKSAIEAMGRVCTLIKSDLSRSDCAEEMLKRVPAADILILNASIQVRRSWERITTEELERQFNCNFRSALQLLQAYAPGMLEKGWGRIITIGSVQEAKPHPDMLAYSCSKAALRHMALSLASQFAPKGVTVNSVAPGVILTDRNVEALSDPDYYEAALRKIPAGFMGEPGDCAALVKLLCGESGRYVTGQNWFVDGGMSL
ncbi:SDR family NAD(P)-dependent oxidoreductase [Paenibacillus sp. YN15]|uniref:SDR family NAD(P)-dependent oxidoreductase n=1 Tax=Paenibacillus sp. YN15 TaxID=1742774 RepID=UPI000DCC0958|nr:SDR family oxidoreductase [Paenibacillus sp. YN15]RAU95717.1 short-chain dehydrogenase [Paenibacillus sp. YN15]